LQQPVKTIKYKCTDQDVPIWLVAVLPSLVTLTSEPSVSCRLTANLKCGC